ncbi:hypothetical protein SynNOUM97013_01851 [Synechococcus sp. NOUM97013]|nr:hypothetical protein SynNOUM97013_01851 [Synechococcus sp. NOUM97013]
MTPLLPGASQWRAPTFSEASRSISSDGDNGLGLHLRQGSTWNCPAVQRLTAFIAEFTQPWIV